MSCVVFAVHAHPDDIEFTMAGTLFHLKEMGCELHYMTVANGSCGTEEYSAEEIVRIRREESIAAAENLGAVYHESITNDMEVFYTHENVTRLAAVVREVAPDIMLLASPQDYIEDHTNSSRLAVSAAFARGMPNYRTKPPTPISEKEVVLYHAMPHGLTDQLRNPIFPDFYVDVSEVINKKEQMLSCHQSQKRWLDVSQGFDSYLKTMRDLSAEVGRLSGNFEYAEGWRRHLHIGFSGSEIDPLGDMLRQKISAGKK